MSSSFGRFIVLLIVVAALAVACGPAAEQEGAQEGAQEGGAVPTGQMVESVKKTEGPTAEVVESAAGTAASTTAPQADLGPEADVDLIFVQHALCAWDSFWCTVEAGVQQAASDMNVNATILGPDTFDLAKVAQLIDQAVAAQPDGIGLTVSDPDLFREPIQRALDAGIPVVAYNAGSGPVEDGIDYLTFLGQDEYQAGALGALRLADAGGTKGVCINHQVGHTGLDARCEGFLASMNASGLPGEVLAISDDPAEAQTIISDYYAANPDTDIFMTLGPNGANPFYAFLDAAGLGPGDCLPWHFRSRRGDCRQDQRWNDALRH